MFIWELNHIIFNASIFQQHVYYIHYTVCIDVFYTLLSSLVACLVGWVTVYNRMKKYMCDRIRIGTLFIKKTPFYGYRDPHYKPKAVWRPSQVYNGSRYTDKTASS